MPKNHSKYGDLRRGLPYVNLAQDLHEIIEKYPSDQCVGKIQQLSNNPEFRITPFLEKQPSMLMSGSENITLKDLTLENIAMAKLHIKLS